MIISRKWKNYNSLCPSIINFKSYKIQSQQIFTVCINAVESSLIPETLQMSNILSVLSSRALHSPCRRVPMTSHPEPVHLLFSSSFPPALVPPPILSFTKDSAFSWCGQSRTAAVLLTKDRRPFHIHTLVSYNLIWCVFKLSLYFEQI